MGKGRLEAFSDGVLAIIITIMVLGEDFKGKISVVVYALAIIASLVSPLISLSLYAVVAIMWLIPDRRIEKKLVEEKPA
jgi:uncharacterized membrane protein